MTSKSISLCRIYCLTIMFLLLQSNCVVHSAEMISVSAWEISYFHMVDNENGWARGSYHGRVVIMKTHDGAHHWQDASPPGILPAFYLDDPRQESVGVLFLNSKTAWVALEHYNHKVFTITVCRTLDGGSTWARSDFEPVVSSSGDDLYVCYADRQTLFILTTSRIGAASQYKAVYRSTDAGKTWISVMDNSLSVSKRSHVLPLAGFTSGMVFNNDLDGWISGAGDNESMVPLSQTTDGGKTWTPKSLRSSSFGEYPDAFEPIFFRNKLVEGILPVSFKRDDGNISINIYTTRNGGVRWQSSKLLRLQSYGFLYSFVDVKRGWIWEEDGTRLYMTSDSGQNWRLLREAPVWKGDFSPEQLNFLNQKIGWLLISTNRTKYGSRATVLLQTRDGGITWQRVQ